MHKHLVVGNWKLNGSKPMAESLVTQLKQSLSSIDINGSDVAIAPPVMYLDFIQELLSGSDIQLGAQNVDTTSSGAYTGDISAAMLKELGVKYVIIGHSERRCYHKENDEYITKKFIALKEQGLTPILCIGETAAENAAGQTQFVCTRQIDAVLNTLGAAAFKDTVIAYEPIWAIGTGKSASPSQAEAVHKFIRNHIAEKNAEIAKQIIIQYGGSVNENNAAELFTKPNINGALVGGASLKADDFTAIIEAAANAKN